MSRTVRQPLEQIEVDIISFVYIISGMDRIRD
jgi:hypothetical protein